MHVFYRVFRSKGRGFPVTYREATVKFCCAEIERQWGRLVAFGVPGAPCSTSRTINLFAIRPQVAGSVVEMVPIAFCPWCGASVKICRAK